MSYAIDISDIESLESGQLHGDVLEKLTMQVEADMRPYVKRDTGALERSAATNSDFRAGRITYSATDERGREYASDAYNDPRVGSHEGQNPKAAPEWASRAETDLGGSWAEYAGELIEEALRDS